MKFAFLVHPLSEPMLRIYGARVGRWDVALARAERLHAHAFDRPLVKTITRFERIVGDTGATCEGAIVGLPTLPQELLEQQESAVELMAAASYGRGWDADIVGLGAVCAVVGLRGQALAAQLDRPVTTGNSLTCWASAETIQRLWERVEGLPRFARRVVVVGLPNAVALALVGVLLGRGLPVEVVHATFPKPLERRLKKLETKHGATVRRWTDKDAALKGKGIVVGAGSIGGELADADVRPGTLVVDVAQPLDTSPAQRAREDLLVIEGELVSMPRASGTSWLRGWTALYNMVVGQGDDRIFACLAEPMVLCLEGRAESFSLGKFLDPERVEALGAMATRQGFGVRALYAGHTRVDDERLRRFVSVPWLP